MIVGVPKETVSGERRVALVPGALAPLIKAGATIRVEAGAGAAAGYPDDEYRAKGAELVDRAAVTAAEVVVQIATYGVSGAAADLMAYRDGQVVVGMADPLGSPIRIQEMAERGVIGFGLELVPRTTRGQAMDVLSSMATIAGYKAVLMAADRLPRIFPMFMTAAGTIKAAKVLVMGAGVAGLQAIATARRLGAVVHGYDVRPVVREQVESLGAKFVDLGVDLGLETAGAEDRGGYAKEQSEDFLRRQREAMTRVVADCDVVITTAAIPGKKSPVLVTAPMVEAMRPGSVIVDLGAERGGNCELTRSGEETVAHGVTIIGPLNLASAVPFHASQMFGKNVANFLKLLIKDGALTLDLADDVVSSMLMCRAGDVVEPRLRSMLGMPPIVAAAAG
jgi:H+-translocating NAD(P) transhydrogenase subunit alpha